MWIPGVVEVLACSTPIVEAIPSMHPGRTLPETTPRIKSPQTLDRDALSLTMQTTGTGPSGPMTRGSSTLHRHPHAVFLCGRWTEPPMPRLNPASSSRLPQVGLESGSPYSARRSRHTVPLGRFASGGGSTKTSSVIGVCMNAMLKSAVAAKSE